MKTTRIVSRRSKFAAPDAPIRSTASRSGSNGKSVGPRGIAVPQSDAKRRAPHDQSQPSSSANGAVLDELYSALGRLMPAAHPRTFKLLQSGRKKHVRKLIEEACEVTVETVKRSADGVVRESADLLYHLVVLWFSAGIEPLEVWREMQFRASTLGIAEKLPKTAWAEDASTDHDSVPNGTGGW